MLRIIACASEAAAKSYYTSGLSREDYYSQGQESPGRWHGLGAARLGLMGRVEREEFAALCENRRPDSGERLTIRQKENRRIGYDFNFHAPKSVSLVHTLNDDERILDVFRASVDATMREMESEMKTRVRSKGASEDRVTGNMVWAEFVHFTSRPVDGKPDPHLHAHCFAFNATYDETESRWKAGQFGDLKRDAGYYEAGFHARLSKGMADLGYCIERQGKGWEIAGVSRELVERYSRRADQVEKEAVARGLETARQKDGLAALTREHKRPELTRRELREEWDGRLSDAERGELARAGQGRELEKIGAAGAVDYAAAHVFERASAVPEKKLLEAALRRGLGNITPEAARAEAGRGSKLLRAEFEGQRFCTTPEIVKEEAAIVDFARRGRGKCAAMAPAWEVKTAWLGKEQRAAVAHICRSADRVISVKGGAGTGKTSMMQEAVAAIRAGGREVYTFAPSADASRGVLRGEGFENADTVARLLQDREFQARLKGQVIWIDEAGLLGVRDMRGVFEVAREQGARVVLSGDVAQHGSVSRGDALRLLQQRGAVQSVALTEIKRQRGTYRAGVEAISRGDLESGLEALDSLGKSDRLAGVVELPEEERYKHLAADYLATLKEGKTALVVSPTHREGAKVTELIREELREAGRLGKEERIFSRLESLALTEAQRQDRANYQPGQVVSFNQHAPDFKRGERWQVVGVENDGLQVVNARGQQQRLALRLADRFQVYKREELPLSAGDRVRITENGFTADRRGRLNNGALHTVEGFGRNGEILLDGGRVLAVDFGKLAHGYCTTSHASQGKTVDRVFIAQGAESSGAASKEQFYVSVSRGRESAKIYTDDKAELMRAASRSGARLSAGELLERSRRSPLPARGPARVKQHGHLLARLREYAEIAGRAAATVGRQVGAAISKGKEGLEPSHG